ncbi:hypothetical protein [Tepidimicrobium xylanilyticum]
MARLPTPIVEKIEVSWSERYEELQKNYFAMIGQAIIRKAERAKRKEKGGKGRDETD